MLFFLAMWWLHIDSVITYKVSKQVEGKIKKFKLNKRSKNKKKPGDKGTTKM